jgi:hypothetical protein
MHATGGDNSNILTGRRQVLVGIVGATCLRIACPPNWCSADPLMMADNAKFERGAKATSWLKFEMPDFRRVIIAGRINGLPAQFLLDSGVGGLVIDKDFAAALKLRSVGGITGVSLMGRAHGEVVEGVLIAFDNLTIHTPSASIYDLTPFIGVLNEPVAALLGRDVFDSLIVDIDFENQRLAFRDRHYKGGLPGGMELPLSRDSLGLRGLPVSIEGRPTIQATCDFGSDRPLSLSPAYVSEQQLLANKRSSTAMTAGATGLEVGQVAVVSDVAVGQIIFHDVPIEVPNAWIFEDQAIIGVPILRRMRMTVDFPHDRVSVLPNHSAAKLPFRKDRSGLGAKRLADRLQIVHVAAHSPAEAAALRVGDEIIAINDEKLDPEYFKKHPRDGSGPAGTNLYLTLANGSKVTLTLADYF